MARKTRLPRLPRENRPAPAALTPAPPDRPNDHNQASILTNEQLLHPPNTQQVRKMLDSEKYRRAYRAMKNKSANQLIRKGLGVGQMTPDQWLVWLRGRPAREARRTIIRLMKQSDVGTQRYLATWVLDKAYSDTLPPEGGNTLIIQEIRAEVINLLPGPMARRMLSAAKAKAAESHAIAASSDPIVDAVDDDVGPEGAPGDTDGA